MRFQRILNALYSQPLDITVPGFQALDAIVRPRLLGKSPALVKDGDFVLGKTDVWGTPLPEMLEIDEENRLAILNITGPLLQHASLLDKSCGACSYQDISRALDQAGENGRVRNIAMIFDSPGGQHCGDIELAEKIALMAQDGEKGIYAYTETTMASAAYCLAAGCNGIFATKTAWVGCIGSLIGFIDFAKAYEMDGMKAVVLASGKYKGAGMEGTSLTTEQEAYLQALVEVAAGQFKEHVLGSRLLEPDAMEGQSFYGHDAQANNLVDEVVSDFEEAVEKLSR